MNKQKFKRRIQRYIISLIHEGNLYKATLILSAGNIIGIFSILYAIHLAVTYGTTRRNAPMFLVLIELVLGIIAAISFIQLKHTKVRLRAAKYRYRKT